MDIKLLSKNKYLQVPLLYSGTGGNVPEWRRHLQPCEYLETDGNSYIKIVDFHYDYNVKLKLEFNQVGDFFGRYGHKGGGNSRNAYVGYSNDGGKFLFLLASGGSQSILTANSNQIIIESEKTNYKYFDFAGNLLEERNWYNYNSTYSNNYLFAAWNNSIIPAPASTKIFYNEYVGIINLIASYVIDEYTDNQGNFCSAGVPGMVDVNTGIFYTNDGPGQFFHGNDIEI